MLLRQEVTGITVNEFPNIKRQFVISISRDLHAWEKFGYKFANRNYARKLGADESCTNLLNVLKGRIAYLKMVKGGNSPLFRKMAFRFNRLSEAKIGIPSLKEIRPYPLRGGYPRRETWNIWYERYTHLIALLNVKKPDSAPVATAFDVGNDMLATAGHNLNHEIDAITFGDDRVKHNEIRNELYRCRKIDVGIIKLEPGQRSINRYLPTQCRLPQIGEEVCAIGYPVLPWRHTTLVMHVGVVEALPIDYSNDNRYIQVSFQSGGGLSGSPLIDKRGFAVGIMVENIFPKPEQDVPARPFGQAVPIEYLHRHVNEVVL